MVQTNECATKIRKKKGKTVDRSVVSFDTSVVNLLAKHPEFEVIRTRINAEYHVRMLETVIAELVSNQDSDLRRHLFKVERMLRCPGDITFPHSELLKSSIQHFEKHGSAFDWSKMSIRSSKMEDHLAQHFPDDELSAAQRKQFSEAEEEWKETFRRFSESFDETAKGDWPKSLVGLVELFCAESGALLPAWGKMLYKKDDGTDADEKSIRRLYDVCPSFRAIMVAMVVQQWERCFRDVKVSPSFRAGRSDTMMATYLPYCNLFVCNDERQRNLLQEVVIHAKIESCTVLSYDQFEEKLSLPQVRVGSHDRAG